MTLQPEPSDVLAADVESFLGWLFRDGGLEPPRHSYDEVEARLRAILAAPAACRWPNGPCEYDVFHEVPATPEPDQVEPHEPPPWRP